MIALTMRFRIAPLLHLRKLNKSTITLEIRSGDRQFEH
jgi:hypothetical protein